MAKVIYRLWQDNNQDLMILPGSLPLYDGSARNELIYYLGPGWDPVIDRDIDGEGAETKILESKETRFGSVQAARRVARTVFFEQCTIFRDYKTWNTRPRPCKGIIGLSPTWANFLSVLRCA